jgi:hypothetical protein
MLKYFEILVMVMVPNLFATIGPDKETKYVILGEKAKAQLIRDSKKDIALSLTEIQKNPLNYTQVSILCLEPCVLHISRKQV